MFKLNLKYPIIWLICLLWCIEFELNWIGIERKWIELELNWKILNPIWIRIELNWKILNPTWIRIELNWKKWIDPSPAEEIAPILIDIYRQSLFWGELSTTWKSAYISPIFKKGAVCKAKNYRPESLTCILHKILKYIVCSHPRTHLDKCGALSPKNHGFVQYHSCDAQFILTIHDLLTRTNAVKSQMNVGILYFAKVFDKVSHGRLLDKLRIFGIDGDIAQWISAFFCDRTQAVVMNESTSRQACVLSGVLQGSHGDVTFSPIHKLPTICCGPPCPGTSICRCLPDIQIH